MEVHDKETTELTTDMYLRPSFQSLPFQKVVHQVSTLDAQPANEAGGILVMVTGGLLVSLDLPLASPPNNSYLKTPSLSSTT